MKEKEIFRPFAETAFALKNLINNLDEQFKTNPNKSIEKLIDQQIKAMKHLLDRSIRVTGDFVPVHASKKAIEYCEVNELGDIFKIGWGNQAKFEKQLNRKTCQLKHEHKITVNDQITKIKKANNVEEVLGIFLTQEIVWVLKSEDALLPKSRRENHDQAYKDAGIEIVKNPYQSGHLFVNK